ncbi:MAG: glycosyltransferase family 39 protein, partial [Rivularia sp. (in: cyanobacteria)]
MLRRPVRSWNAYLKLLVVGALVLALVFRLGNLSTKPYWGDEVFTSMRVSGYRSGDIKSKINGRLVPVEELYQYRDVGSGRSWRNTLGALSGRPEHAPLYFVLARLWAQVFGSSVGAMRSLPAVISLLTLPLFYWLSRLLFNSSEVAKMTLCLACVSPIFIRQA